MSTTLTPNERATAEKQVIKAMRARMDAQRPDRSTYGGKRDKWADASARTLNIARALTPVIAVFAMLASAVRTIQTASEIYTASGSHPIGVLIAAIGFTVGAEVALFIMALAQEGERIKRRREKAPRNVSSLATIARAVGVRIGIRKPLSHDQMPQADGSGLVIAIAFLFAVAANFYMGMRPLLAELATGAGEPSLQTFLASLGSAPATLQVQFVVDLAAVLFPPLMAYASGHLVARWAGELASANEAAEAAYAADLAAWRTAYAEPLATDEAQERLERLLAEKLAAKQARRAARPQPTEQPDPHPKAAAPTNGTGH